MTDCKVCGKPLATDADYDKYEPGEGTHLCWEPESHDEVDMEERIEELRTELAECQGERDALIVEYEQSCELEAEAQGFLDECRNSLAAARSTGDVLARENARLERELAAAEATIVQTAEALDSDCGSRYHDHCGCGSRALRMLEEYDPEALDTAQEQARNQCASRAKEYLLHLGMPKIASELAKVLRGSHDA